MRRYRVVFLLTSIFNGGGGSYEKKSQQGVGKDVEGN